MEISGVRQHVLLCNGRSCTRKGAEEVTNAIRDEIKGLGLSQTIHTTKTLCNGQCKRGPTVIVYPDGVWYQHMTPESGKRLIRHLQKGEHLNDNISYCYDGECFYYQPNSNNGWCEIRNPGF